MENERVLLLNASFEPIRVITLRRALVLVYQESADVIEETGRFVKSERSSHPIPSVIKLRNYVNIPYRSKVPLNRRTLLMRDNHECQFTHCSRRATTIDHVIPRSKGGKNVWENVVGACQKCNAKKADKLMSEIGWKLKNGAPAQPNWNVWLVAGIRERPEWVKYLEHFGLS